MRGTSTIRQMTTRKARTRIRLMAILGTDERKMWRKINQAGVPSHGGHSATCLGDVRLNLSLLVARWGLVLPSPSTLRR